MSDENDAPDPGTMDAIRAALAEEARGLADSRTFKPAYVWQVVAAALPEIDMIVEASKGRGKDATKAAYDDIAAKLRKASGFEELSGESVRQYRPRIKCGRYDVQLARIGFRRVGSHIVAIADLPKADEPLQINAPAVRGEPLATLIGRAVPERTVSRSQPDDNSDDAAPKRLR